MLKKTLLATTFIVASSSIAYAEVSFNAENDKTSLNIGGSLTVTSPAVTQTGQFKKLGRNQNGNIIVNENLSFNKFAVSANLSFDVNFKPDEDSCYGFFTKLNTITSALTASGNPEHSDKTMIYLENKTFGRLEAGSHNSAYDRIKIAPSALAIGTGGIDGDLYNFFISGAFLAKNNPLTYSNASCAFHTSVNLPASDATRANKITYYTPNYNGLAIGLSFTPDTEHQGTIFDVTSGQIGKKGLGYTDTIETAIRYEATTNDVNHGLSLVGNFGKSKDYQEPNGNTFKRNNLMAFEVATSLAFKGFKLAAAYGYLGKSGTIKSITDNNNHGVAVTDYLKGKPANDFYSLGAAYESNKVGTSVTYLNSSALGLLAKDEGQNIIKLDQDGNKNRFQALSVGVSYKIFENLAAFVEYAHFQYTKKSGASVGVVPAYRPITNKFSLNKGNVVLAGLKVGF
ncbi:MAG: porin [Candidatus Midichloria sp.]|nr:MAG: porin [Candidatus Midichloria sp.]